MMNLFLELLLVGVGLIFTIVFFRYLFSTGKSNQQAFLASDGTKFVDLKSCDEYELLFKKLQCLYDDNNVINNRGKKDMLGLQISFVKNLKEQGFQNIKTLIDHYFYNFSYKYQNAF